MFSKRFQNLRRTAHVLALCGAFGCAKATTRAGSCVVSRECRIGESCINGSCSYSQDTGPDGGAIDIALPGADIDQRDARVVPDASFGEATLGECSDNVDNDGNGYIDCDDIHCALVRTGCPDGSIVGCLDGVDSDRNGFTDCDDFACNMNTVFMVCGEDTNAQCSDGVDNNGNGYVDCADWSCFYRQSVSICR